MPEQVLSRNLVHFDGLALRPQTRDVRLSIASEPQDVTTLADLTRSRLGGLEDVAFSCGGFWDAAEPDASLLAALGVSDSLISVADGETIGNVAYFFRALAGQYNPIEAGRIGDPHGFLLEAGCYAGDLYRGTLMEAQQFTVTGDGTGRQIGSVSASQSIRLALHVTAVTGDWDVVVESDDNAGFTSGTDRITEAGITAVGGFYQALAGAITDDYWRVHVVENSAGSITLAAILSIQ